MAWETRGNQSYYYRSRRVNGKVVKEYVGSGDLADSIAALEALDRQRGEMERSEAQAERREQAELEDEIEAYCRQVDDTLAEVLTALGYHRHDRGAWRRKRQGGQEGTTVGPGRPRGVKGANDGESNG
jgi:hypothetical protein